MTKNRTPMEKLVSASKCNRERDRLMSGGDCRAMGSFYLVADAAPSHQVLNEMGLRPVGGDSLNIQVCIFADFGRKRVLDLARMDWVRAVYISRVT